jgi:hypothetical protein
MDYNLTKEKVQKLLVNATEVITLDIEQKDLEVYKKEADKIDVSVEDFLSAIVIQYFKKQIRQAQYKKIFKVISKGLSIVSLLFASFLSIGLALVKSTFISEVNVSALYNAAVTGWGVVALFSLNDLLTKLIEKE